MTETFVYKGMWWLPDNPSKKVSGTLTINQEEQISLETIGKLGDKSIIDLCNAGSISEYNVCWGISSDSKPITVFGRVSNITTRSSCPFSIVTFTADFVAIGAYIKSVDEVRDYEVKVRFHELSLWFRPNCFQYLDAENGHGMIIDKKNNNKIFVSLDDGCDLRLEGEAKSFYNNSGLGVNMEQYSVLYFSFDHLISMGQAKNMIFQFEQFLSLATLSFVQCSHFALIDKEMNTEIDVFEKKVDRNFNSRFQDYLFDYEMVKDSFSRIIKNWYREKYLYPIRKHLIDSVSHKGYFEANDFLIVCQAIEGFYYRFRKHGKIDFTQIFKNLIEEFNDIKVQEVSKDDLPYIRETRHYFTHLLPHKKDHVLDGSDLYFLNYKLRKLLLCCILKLIGFTDDEINNIFSKSNNPYLKMIGCCH